MAKNGDRIAACPVCGTAFRVGSYGLKYCSDKCRMKVKCQRKKDKYRKTLGLPPGAEIKRKPKSIKEKICIVCGEVYTPTGTAQKQCADCRERDKWTPPKNKRQIRKPRTSLQEKIMAARAAGMSYGKYIAITEGFV